MHIQRIGLQRDSLFNVGLPKGHCILCWIAKGALYIVLDYQMSSLQHAEMKDEDKVCSLHHDSAEGQYPPVSTGEGFFSFTVLRDQRNG